MSVSLDQYEIKHISIAASSSGSNTVITGVSKKQIWVLEVVLISNGSVNVKFQTGSLDITGLFYLIANTGFAKNHGGANYAIPFCKTRTGDALKINLSDNVAVGGTLSYIEVETGQYSSSSSSSRSSSSSSRSSSSSSSSSSCRSSSSSSRSSSSSSSSANP